MTSRERVLAVLNRKRADRIVVCPNIWQWFDYHKAEKILPSELADCVDQVDAMKRLGFDVCTRNAGGAPVTTYHQTEIMDEPGGIQRMITPRGELRLRVVMEEESHTSFVTEFWVKSKEDLRIYQAAVEDREVHLDTAGYEALKNRIGDHGIAMVPLLCSPLKLLHIIAGLETSCFLLADAPEACEALFEVYTGQVMRLADECCRSSAEVFMTMDNLDSLSHSPRLLRQYGIPFYQALGDKLRSAGKLLFSHACGHLKKIRPEIRESRLDGIEGIAPPPLGDLSIADALAISDSFIANGGMTVHVLEKEGPDAAARIDGFTRELFASIRPSAHRFLYSSGCNTSIRTPLDNLKYWRDAVWKHGGL